MVTHRLHERIIFGLALALATEPSKLGQLRQMLVQHQELQVLPEEFLTWALGEIDERVMSMALEYAHDPGVMLHILSFKGGTFASLLQDIEDLYQHERISQRVYAKAKLFLRAMAPPKPEKTFHKDQHQPDNRRMESHSTVSPGLEQALIEMLASLSIPIIIKVETDDDGQPF